jgi:hypothetical protein
LADVCGRKAEILGALNVQLFDLTFLQFNLQSIEDPAETDGTRSLQIFSFKDAITSAFLIELPGLKIGCMDREAFKPLSRIFNLRKRKISLFYQRFHNSPGYSLFFAN